MNVHVYEHEDVHADGARSAPYAFQTLDRGPKGAVRVANTLLTLDAIYDRAESVPA